MSVLSLMPDDKKKDIRKESVESVYSSNSRLNLLSKRKKAVPQSVAMSQLGKGDRYVTQRVLSAKTHRVKQLQNQLADAHYHLQELSNENRVLRALQKKQEIALQRYENSNAELPQVLNSHNEEIRVQQSRCKQLRQQCREMEARLKERDLQLQQLRDEHQHLLELARDKGLPEREKLMAQVKDLNAKVEQQAETITALQRRLALEAKNFRHQLRQEINKHKDTRNDLDLAISNADKLSTIIEMKERMLSTAASRVLKSPVKNNSTINVTRPLSKTNKTAQESSTLRVNEERQNVDRNVIAKLCENSRSVSSALSNDEETSSSTEPRSRYARSSNSTSNRSTPSTLNPKKSNKPDDPIEIAKAVQDGMADLAIADEENALRNCTPDEMQERMEMLKADLLKKIKNNEEPVSRRNSALRRKSTEESIEEQMEAETDIERPKSRGRRNSSVSFYEVEEVNTKIAVNEFFGDGDKKLQREDKRQIGKPIESYCKDIMQDLEKSSKVIDRHIKQFNSTKQDSDKLVDQLKAVDKINELVNSNGDIPESALSELNNNFRMLTDQVLDAPVPRKRSVSGRRSTKLPIKTDLLGDVNMTNQDLLDDLLGKK